MTTLARPPLPPGVRARCEATIERLIAFLDQFEPDTDLEDDGEAGHPTTLEDMNPVDSPDSEPSLGAPNASETTGCNWLRGLCYGDDRELDPSELEPSIGAPETTCTPVPCSTDSQEYTWSLLGGVNGMQDYEHDPAECGIADADGAAEQLGRFQGIVAN